MTEHSFQGIRTSRQACLAGGVTHVSGTICHLCLGPLEGLTVIEAPKKGLYTEPGAGLFAAHRLVDQTHPAVIEEAAHA